jgi:hypothetical protein
MRTSIIFLLIASSCTSKSATELAVCSYGEQNLFVACIDAGCSASYSQGATGEDSCDLDGGASVVHVEAGGECAFTSTGNCYVVCSCPEGTSVTADISPPGAKDTSRPNDTSSPQDGDADSDADSDADTDADADADADTSSDTAMDTGSSTDTGPTEDDWDRDGFTESEGDCDDASSAFSPVSTDSVGDGRDQNCDGADGVDADGDTEASRASGGNDCDDSISTINSFNTALDYSDSVDSDCDNRDETNWSKFSYKDIYSTSWNASTAYMMSDLDADGMTDFLLFPTDYSVLRVWGSTIKSGTLATTSVGGAKAFAPSVFDHDNDGLIDLMASCFFDSTLLTNAIISSPATYSCPWSYPVYADINASGSKDVGMMLENLGVISPYNSTAYLTSNLLYTGDIGNTNNITSAEVLTRSPSSSWVRNTQGTHGCSKTSYPFDPCYAPIKKVSLGDCDSDGSLDYAIEIASTSGGYASVETTSPRASYLVTTLSASHFDFDQSGYVEVSLTSGYVVRCDGNNLFTSKEVVDQAGDLDNDGHVDAHVVRAGKRYIGISSSTFYTGGRIELEVTSLNPYWMIAGNWDADASPELLVYDTTSPNSVRMYDLP